MNYQPKVTNQGKQLKVNKSTNYLMPPYRKPTTKEQQQYEQSKQLSILPILQPTPQQLIQHQQVQKPNQVVKTKPTTKQTTKTKPQSNTTKPTPPKKDLKKQKEEMLDWLNNVKIQ
ncbi:MULTISPECIES: hypothetical protein [Prochlorococcus]|uniref:hypothetical protein n=1 Tax=Prochlorococcus TaxID=1218 RepID=UPI0007BB29BC|nr:MULTISPECIES: hypothetical protein [Prochlorococcus]KZR66446.1 hypothetical protein PMIT1312_00911 [Prochlorococcus marinus str. MIT 1312]KZR83386.1 hypothetical protein PMIT1327_00468 [Prochlorococcus marinus str. MIT 1327]NMO83158.1 hypothetical protein [Prochlorococcus sp. P1344]NMP06160.1 hypothetical protein [Prochlorococcus sp. P1361]NMP12301.1 hypothetical protein [Prochlorococcus sp.P1363]